MPVKRLVDIVFQYNFYILYLKEAPTNLVFEIPVNCIFNPSSKEIVLLHPSLVLIFEESIEYLKSCPALSEHTLLNF